MRIPSALLKEFIASLSGKASTTVDAYQRELRHFLDWISQRAGNSGPFDAQQDWLPRQIHDLNAVNVALKS
jgi:site-specific recombinase XerD